MPLTVANALAAALASSSADSEYTLPPSPCMYDREIPNSNQNVKVTSRMSKFKRYNH